MRPLRRLRAATAGACSRAPGATGSAARRPGLGSVSMSGHGRQVSVLVQSNSDEFAAPAEAFVSSVELILPNTAQPQAAPAGSAAPPIVVTGRPGNQGITIATTNFDDGWVAQPFADYVRVAREQTVVLLHYGIEITDEMRQAASMARFLWDRIAAPRYSAGGLQEYQNSRTPTTGCTLSRPTQSTGRAGKRSTSAAPGRGHGHCQRDRNHLAFQGRLPEALPDAGEGGGHAQLQQVRRGAGRPGGNMGGKRLQLRGDVQHGHRRLRRHEHDRSGRQL